MKLEEFEKLDKARTPNYDVYYFIRKFAAIPESMWGTGRYVSAEGTRMCALGHCGARSSPAGVFFSEEARALYRLEDGIGLINDGTCPDYEQLTPKKRILAALRDIACSQLPDDNSDGDFILNTAFGPVTIVEDPLVDPNSYGFVLPNKTWSTI